MGIEKRGTRVTDKGAGEQRNDIWEKVYHTDARVTAMEGQIKDVHNSVSRIETLLLNKKETSPLAWFGVIFSVLTLCGGLIALMVGFVGLSLEPVHQDLSDVSAAMSDYSEFKHQTHYELGMLHEWKKDTVEDLVHNHDRMHVIQDRVRDVEITAATTEERVETNAEEQQRMDVYGSRRWNTQRPPNN